MLLSFPKIHQGAVVNYAVSQLQLQLQDATAFPLRKLRQPHLAAAIRILQDAVVPLPPQLLLDVGPRLQEAAAFPLQQPRLLGAPVQRAAAIPFPLWFPLWFPL